MSNAEKVKWSYKVIQDILDLTLKKDVLFIIGDRSAKVGSQEIPGVTGILGLGVQMLHPGQRLSEFFQENTLVIANPFFQQHKRVLCIWTSLHVQYQNQIEYILFGHGWKKALYNQ